MKNYIEIELNPAFNMPYHVLLSRVVQQLHLGFVNNPNIAISFPQYNSKKHSLGNVIRLFGTVETLQNLNVMTVLNNLLETVIITDILDVPTVKKYATFSRHRYNYGHTFAGLERAARRKSKRSGMPYQEALEYLTSFNIAEEQELPFVSIKSISTGGIFRLYIKCTECSAEKVVDDFNSYGLSNVNTVPVF
jgi:CRISPR-associated endonuclease Csy4